MTRTHIDHETATYEYACNGCGVITRLSNRGGNLDCTCDPPAPADKVHVTVAYTDGERKNMGTMADIFNAHP